DASPLVARGWARGRAPAGARSGRRTAVGQVVAREPAGGGVPGAATIKVLSGCDRRGAHVQLSSILETTQEHVERLGRSLAARIEEHGYAKFPANGWPP